MATPRGIRNNNPGNIEWGSSWQGLVPAGKRTDSRFAQFTDAAYGIRALAVTLITYQDKRRASDGSPIDTVFEAISRWAPPVENNTKAYATEVAKAISKSTGRQIDMHDVLDFHDFDVMFGLVSGIIRHENGKGPKATLSEWYDDATIVEGLRRAGIIKQKPVVAGLPVNTETKVATGVGAAGVVQIADVIPEVSAALTKSQDNLTSGDWVRIGIGVATLGFAVYLAYAQIKKRRAGAF